MNRLECADAPWLTIELHRNKLIVKSAGNTVHCRVSVVLDLDVQLSAAT